MKYDVLLLDGLNVFHRAANSYELGYWKNDEYFETGAIFGFLKIAMTFWKRHAAPNAQLIVCWDAGYDHRLALYPEYKANRRVAPADEEARENKALIKRETKTLKEVLRACGWLNAHASGFEADDVLATLAKRFSDEGKAVALCTSDQDLHQSVNERVHVISSGPMGEKVWDLEAVLAKWGLPPRRVAEAKALMGDGGDNIPGCHGCGNGWAQKILTAYAHLDAALSAAESGELSGVFDGKPWVSPRWGLKLRDSSEIIKISHELAKVVEDCPVEFNSGEFNPATLKQLFHELSFHSLLESKAWAQIEEIRRAPVPSAEPEMDTFDLFS